MSKMWKTLSILHCVKNVAYEYKMAGKWLAHVKKTMKKMAGQKKSMGKKWFSHVLKSAKKTYHGGASDSSSDSSSDSESAPTGGKRRRTRRHRK